MAIQTSIKKSFVYWNLLYFVLCAGLGAWGAYDYWVSIPAKEEAVERYENLMDEFAGLELRGQYAQLAAKRANRAITEDELAALQELETTLREAGVSGPPPPLGTTERARYAEIKEILTEEFENTMPEPPAFYDRWVNLWVYTIGTGILGAPFFAWKLISRRGRTWQLEDDGSLSTPDGTFTTNQIEDIDMSLWMKKSVATVVVSADTNAGGPSPSQKTLLGLWYLFGVLSTGAIVAAFFVATRAVPELAAANDADPQTLFLSEVAGFALTAVAAVPLYFFRRPSKIIGSPLLLDDYEYQDIFKIVGALAHKFHPDDWTSEAKPVKEGDAEDSTDDAATGETVAEADASDAPAEGDRQA